MRMRAELRRLFANAKAGTAAWIGRLPVRVRLTLSFAVLMVVLFGTIALILYFSFAAGLDQGIRNSLASRATVLQAGALRLDPSSRRAWYSDTELSLTAREFSLLETFMRHPGEVLSRFELLEHVWDDSYENRSNVIDVYVGYLRDKLDRPFGTQMLETVRGAGYRLKVDEGDG